MSTSRKRGRGLRVGIAAAIAALGVSAIGVSAASADVITLNHGFLKISGLEAPQEVITPANSVKLTTGAALPGAFTVNNNADVNDVQTISQGAGTTTGGTFTITVDANGGPQTTSPIPYNAPLRNNGNVAGADDIAEALGDLSNLGYFDVKLSGGPLPATPVTLEFVGASVYGQPIPDISIDSTNLTPGGSTYVQGDSVDGASKSDFDFPQFEGSVSGVPLGVDVKPLTAVNGNFNSGTGVLTTTATNYTATVALGPPAIATCTITPINLAFSTADNSVFKGDLFDAATPPVNGAISDDWSSLPSDANPACGLINGLTAGPGGLWLSNGIATPTLVPPPVDTPPATTPPATTPKKPKCKKGQKLKKVKGKFKCVKKKKKKKK
jgi:hypothetical protein